MRKVAIQRRFGSKESSWRRIFELNSFEVATWEDMCMLYRSDLKEFVKRRFFKGRAKIMSKPFVGPDLVSESLGLLENAALTN